MTKELIATTLREVCETDPADATLPTTVCINVDALGRIVEQALAQQEQPASVDAYAGAREDAAIWKKRALEAEELNRKFIADVNGPTYLGEPVKQKQPSQEPVAWLIPSLASFKDAKSVSFSRVEGCTLTDAQLIEKMSGEVLWRAEVFSDGEGVKDKHGTYHAPKPLYTHPAPTQPALSESGIGKACEAVAVALDSAYDCNRVWDAWSYGTMTEGDFSLVSEDLERVREIAIAAIEAYCRGGASHMNNQEFQERVVEILENLVSSLAQRDFGWVLRQVRNLYEDVREAAKQGGQQ